MKKILALVLLSYFTPSPFAQASVCLLQSQGDGGDWISDSGGKIICDGKATNVEGVTGTLQKYLSNGYKITSQSGPGGSVIWTLVK